MNKLLTTLLILAVSTTAVFAADRSNELYRMTLNSFNFGGTSTGISKHGIEGSTIVVGERSDGIQEALDRHDDTKQQVITIIEGGTTDLPLEQVIANYNAAVDNVNNIEIEFYRNVVRPMQENQRGDVRLKDYYTDILDLHAEYLALIDQKIAIELANGDIVETINTAQGQLDYWIPEDERVDVLIAELAAEVTLYNESWIPWAVDHIGWSNGQANFDNVVAQRDALVEEHLEAQERKLVTTAAIDEHSTILADAEARIVISTANIIAELDEFAAGQVHISHYGHDRDTVTNASNNINTTLAPIADRVETRKANLESVGYLSNGEFGTDRY